MMMMIVMMMTMKMIREKYDNLKQTNVKNLKRNTGDVAVQLLTMMVAMMMTMLVVIMMMNVIMYDSHDDHDVCQTPQILPMTMKIFRTDQGEIQNKL